MIVDLRQWLIPSKEKKSKETNGFFISRELDISLLCEYLNGLGFSPFDRKLVSVKFAGFTLALPTLSFAFCKMVLVAISQLLPRRLELSITYLKVLLLLFLFLRAGPHGLLCYRLVGMPYECIVNRFEIQVVHGGSCPRTE